MAESYKIFAINDGLICDKVEDRIGVLKLDVYCVVHYFKQERGQKRVSTALVAIQN